LLPSDVDGVLHNLATIATLSMFAIGYVTISARCPPMARTHR